MRLPLRLRPELPELEPRRVRDRACFALSRFPEDRRKDPLLTRLLPEDRVRAPAFPELLLLDDELERLVLVGMVLSLI